MKLSHPLLLCLTGAFVALAPSTSYGATLLPSQDTDLYKNLGIPTSTVEDISISSEFAGQHVLRGFMEFDLSSLGYSPGATVTSAQLWLYASSVSAAGNINIQDLTADWSVGSLTWDNQPGVGAFLTSTGISTAGWYAFDITSLVQGWVNDSSTNYGLRINSPLAAGATFVSADATGGNAAFTPYLVVTPEPGRALLLTMALGAAFVRRSRGVASGKSTSRC